MEFFIDFQPVGQRGRCQDNQSLLEAGQQLGVDIVSLCGGKGTCGRCKIQILDGLVSPPTPSEIKVIYPQELKDGYRLACQTYPLSDCKLRVPPESLTTPQRTQVEGLEIAINPDPPVRTYKVQLTPPSQLDPQADAERLLQAVDHQHQVHCHRIDIEVLRNLSPQLRSWNWQAQVSVRGNELVALTPWDSRQLGLAVDLGTTKVAGYLVDLDTGETLAAQGTMNPQISYGEDVISRITHAMGSSGERAHLQKLAAEGINQLIMDLCTQVDAEPKEIIETVIVGNTVMHHLLLDLSVSQLALFPFLPAVRGTLDVRARDIGLCTAPGTYAHFLPNIAGFVGADHVAILLATQSWWNMGMVIVVDIGTNTEISLVSNGEISSVSCASGPAFEGAHISNGMRAASGAIERLHLIGEQVEYQTIDGKPAVGICGSGILDAIAQFRLADIIPRNGKIRDHKRVRTHDGQRELVLVNKSESAGVRDIVITQQDVREVQLAKAAIRAGMQLLLEATGHSEKDVDRVIIAGAFGNYIDVASAVTIGMFPPLPLECFQQIGNGAGMGAKLALISQNKRNEAQTIADRVQYIELATNPRFSEIFAQAMYIG